MVKSSTVLKYIGQYGFLVAGIGWLGKSLFDTVHGLLTSDWKTDEIIARGIIGLLHLAAFLYFRISLLSLSSRDKAFESSRTKKL